MSNQVEVAPVGLTGRGLVVRGSNNYVSGEFQECQNLVLTPNGSLKKRPGVHGLVPPGTGDFHKFLGYRGENALGTRLPNDLLSMDNNSWQAVTRTGTGNLETSLEAKSLFGAGNRNYCFEGYVQYNNRDHLIVVHSKDPLYNIYVASGPNNTRLKSTLTMTTEDFVVSDKICTQHSEWSNSKYYPPTVIVPSFEVHKDRLWIAHYDTVYFSKTADFLSWTAASDGGFFKFPGKTIKKIVPLGDNIYIIFDNSVSVISYSSGPNFDASIRTVSEILGGEDAIVYEGTIYLSKSNAIYTINGNNIVKLLDLDLGVILHPHFVAYKSGPVVPDPANSSKGDLKLVGFNGALYIIPRITVYYLVLGVIQDLTFMHYLPAFSDGIYRIDLATGFVSKFLFGGSVSGNGPTRVFDGIYVPVDDDTNSAKLVLVGKSNAVGGTSVFYFGSNQVFRYANSTDEDKLHKLIDNTLDTYGHTGTLTLYACPINVKLTIANFSPDNLRYLIKKFRTISVEADVPMWSNEATPAIFVPELELKVKAGLEALGTGVLSLTTILNEDLANTNIGEQEIRSFRFGVVQRAKSITISINTRSVVDIERKAVSGLTTANPDAVKTILKSLLEIVDIRTAWTYTGRDTSNVSGDKS